MGPPIREASFYPLERRQKNTATLDPLQKCCESDKKSRKEDSKVLPYSTR